MNEQALARAFVAQPVDRPDRVAEASLRTDFQRNASNTFTGHAFNPAEPSRRYVVQLLIDGVPLQLAVAEQFDESLARQAAGDGCHGFSFVVAPEVLNGATIVEARIANAGTPVGKPVRLAGTVNPTAAVPGRRGVRWVGGLRFAGWLEGVAPDVPKVCAWIDGAMVVEAHARAWHHVGGRGKEATAVPAFDLQLPTRFADGKVRIVRVVDEAGSDLPGSPLTFVAFEDGLERVLSGLAQVRSEQLRGEMFDRLIPSSMPMARYAEWQTRFPPSVPAPDTAPIGVVLAGEDENEGFVRSLEAQTHSNWVAATLPAGGADVALDSLQLTGFIENEAAACDVFVFVAGGMQLAPHAIAALAAACRQHPSSAAIYADFSLRGRSGECWPVFLPAFDYERMLEQGCGALLFATRREHLERALKVCPANLFQLFQALACDPVGARGAMIHLPGSLGTIPDGSSPGRADALAAATAAHLGSRGIAADVAVQDDGVFPSVRVMRRREPQSVSIIIPTRNQSELLRRCLETIAPAARRASAEIIVVDNDSAEPDALDYLASIEGRDADVLRVPGAFNFSRLNNLAAAAARGDHLLLLNNDIEAIDAQWLDEMLGRMAEPDVGAVGATLLWPSGVVQHAGVVLGPGLGAVHAFNDRMGDDAGYAGMLTAAHECSAVTAACLLTRKADYLAVGGLDEVNFPVNFNDVDYCLKLRALGRRIVISPHARLLHLESASRGSDQRPDRAGRLQRELRALRARWLETIVNDPYYSPLLSLDPIPFSALAWPPRDATARLNRLPQPVSIPPGM